MKRFLFGVAVGFALYHAWLVFREMFGTPAMPDDFHEWTEAELDSLKAYLKSDWHNIDLERLDELEDTQPVKVTYATVTKAYDEQLTTEAKRWDRENTSEMTEEEWNEFYEFRAAYTRALIKLDSLDDTQPIFTQGETSVNCDVRYLPQQEHIYTDNGPIQVTYDS